MKQKIVCAVVFLSLLSSISCATPNVIILPNGAKAYYYIPPQIEGYKYTFLIALHGKGSSARSSFDFWHDIAVKHHLILLAPQGTGTEYSYFNHLRKNIKNVVKFTYMIKKKRYFSNNNIVLAGFSMGGGFAVDLAMNRPKLYSKVLCVFGFYQDRHIRKLRKIKSADIKAQDYYFITGKGDVTQDSLTRGAVELRRRGAKVKLVAVPDLYHEFPLDFNSTYPEVFHQLGANLTGNISAI